MKKYLLAFALVLSLSLSLCAPAYADNLTATFTARAPLTYEDGMNIGSDDTLSYFLYCGEVSGDYNIALNVTTDLVEGGEEVSVSLCVTTPGTYYFVGTAYSFLYKTESVYSNEITKTFIAQDFTHIPNPPTILSVSP